MFTVKLLEFSKLGSNGVSRPDGLCKPSAWQHENEMNKGIVTW